MRKTINVLLVVAVVFWVVVLVRYLTYYQPIIKAFTDYISRTDISPLRAIEQLGSQIGYIWLNLAKIGTFAFGTIATLIFLAQREKPPV